MNLPIIFIHKGNSWYLPYTLWQAHCLNPASTIYFIGDKSTRHFPNWVKHVNIDHYQNSTDIIRKVYRHHSKLGQEFELTCIERWFILHDFMVKQQMEQCVYLDSDVLVYENLTKAHQKLQPHDMTWCSFSAHTNFINNREALQHYCNNVIDLYTDKFPKGLKPKSLFHQVLKGEMDMNISDMTFFHDYNVRYPHSLLAIDNPNPSGTFDISIEDTRIFEEDKRGFKKFFWKGKQPWGKVKETGELVPFVTLHFQGKGKTYLKKGFQHSHSYFYWLHLTNILTTLHLKFENKIVKPNNNNNRSL